MNKKQFYTLLVMTLSLFGIMTGLTACGDDEEDNGGNTKPTASLTLRSQTIQNGAEVEAESTTVLTLTYNTIVSISETTNSPANDSTWLPKTRAAPKAPSAMRQRNSGHRDRTVPRTFAHSPGMPCWIAVIKVS